MAKKQTKKQAPELPAKTLAAVRAHAEKLTKPHGLEVHDIRFGPTDFGLTLSVIIRAGESEQRPLSITDCEVVSRPLSKELDELMADYPADYLFEVTSVGIDEEKV
jgi:ribosome maturation factor RimP